MRVVYWITRNEATRLKICRRFDISESMNVNRESGFRRALTAEEWTLLQECAAYGYLEIRQKSK
jgi:hypothetical protein